LLFIFSSSVLEIEPSEKLKQLRHRSSGKLELWICGIYMCIILLQIKPVQSLQIAIEPYLHDDLFIFFRDVCSLPIWLPFLSYFLTSRERAFFKFFRPWNVKLWMIIHLIMCIMITLDYLLSLPVSGSPFRSSFGQRGSSFYHFLRLQKRNCLALINLWVWVKASGLVYHVPYQGIGRNFNCIMNTLKDWTVLSYFCLMFVMSSTFAIVFHIRFADRQIDGEHTFGQSLKFAFKYFMNSEQGDGFLKKPEHFDALPFGVLFFGFISCVSLLFHNLATGLMESVREMRHDQWLNDHLDMQLAELAYKVKTCRVGGPTMFRFFTLLFGQARPNVFRCPEDQYYVLHCTPHTASKQLLHLKHPAPDSTSAAAETGLQLGRQLILEEAQRRGLTKLELAQLQQLVASCAAGHSDGSVPDAATPVTPGAM
jgi:hypothetical protein